MRDLYAPEALGLPAAKPKAKTRTKQLLLLLLIGAGSVLIILSAMRGNDLEGPLSPDSADPAGSLALATLLRAEGVTIIPATTLAEVTNQDRAGQTVFVAGITTLKPSAREALRNLKSDVVFVGDPFNTVTELSHFVETSPLGSATELAATCNDPDAIAANRISPIQGSLLATDQSVTLCFTEENRGGYAVWSENGNPRRAIADATLLSNQRLALDGNAALAMRSLGKHNTVVWYLPSYEHESQAIGYSSPWFRALIWFAVFLSLTGIGYAAPRFGPLAIERLPVVVRSGEIVRGVGRLYASRRALPHATKCLRDGSRHRLATQLGFAPDAGETEILTALAAATNRSVTELRALMYGPAPTTGEALHELATQLARLESEIQLS